MPRAAKLIQLPPGVTELTETLVVADDTVLRGSGNYDSTLRQADGANLEALVRTAETAEARTAGAKYTIHGAAACARIENLVVDGNRARNERGVGLWIYGLAHALDRVWVVDCPDEPVVLDHGPKLLEGPWRRRDTMVQKTCRDVWCQFNAKPFTIRRFCDDVLLDGLHIANADGDGLLNHGANTLVGTAHIWGNAGRGVVNQYPLHAGRLETEWNGLEGLVNDGPDAALTIANLVAYGNCRLGGESQVRLVQPASVAAGVVTLAADGKPAFWLSDWAARHSDVRAQVVRRGFKGDVVAGESSPTVLIRERP